MREGLLFRAVIPGFCGSLLLTSAAGADAPAAAIVWYRASEECPSGVDFLGKLPGGAARARLAGAGDHIDFVVTLVAGHGGTTGRLERQTQAGTVAIRELGDVSCARVAEALALSLELALDPAAPGSSPNNEPATRAEVAPSSGSMPAAATPSLAPVAGVPAPRTEPAPVMQASASKPQPAMEARSNGVPARARPRWSSGLEGGALFGAAPSASPRAALVIAVDHVLPTRMTDLGVRFALVGAEGSTSTAVGPVRQWIAAARGEVCPWRWGGERVGLRPCADFELGAIGASDSRQSGEHAVSPWVAPGGGLRVGVAVLPKLTLELGVDALFPLVRNEVDAGSTRLYRGDFAAFSGHVGVFVGPF